jgi:spermidine synthase
MKEKIAIRVMLFGVGFLSIGFQIILMREYLSLFQGTEFILGVLLSCWLLFTGAGSFIAKFTPATGGRGMGFTLLAFFTGFWPPVSVFLIHYLKSVMLPAGSMAGMEHAVLWGTVAELPFCLASGYLFVHLSSTDSTGPATAYSIESSGSIVAAAIVNFFFLWFLDVYPGLFLITGIWTGMLIIYTWLMNRWKPALVSAFAGMTFFALLFSLNLTRQTENLDYPEQAVSERSETPYGRIVVTSSNEQDNFYENGLLLFSSGNEINNEEQVHPAMVQHATPRIVLMISGGLGGSVKEVLKYHPERTDYLELNPALIRIAAADTQINRNSGVNLVATDARRFLRSSNIKYDAVLVSLPLPSTLQINRYYTIEFLQELKKHLSDSAVISYVMPTSSDYVSDEATDLHASLWRTLRKNFRHVLIVPLQRNIFLASDACLSLNIPGMIETAKIPTVYINKYYLDTGQLIERSGYVSGQIDPEGSINRDFSPVAIFSHLVWHLGYFSINPWLVVAVPLLLILILVLLQNHITAGLFTGGFSLAAIEIMLIAGYQVLFGYVYGMIGAIVMVFMAGLAIGAWLFPRIVKTADAGLYPRLQLLMAVFTILLPVALIHLSPGNIPSWISQTFLFILTFLPAAVAGTAYSAAIRLTGKDTKRSVSSGYAADLFGSAAGAFLAGIVLIPLAGFLVTGITLTLLNTASVFFFLRGQKKAVTL